MVTGESWMFSVQDASHGAGQTRPVNSGKLLVECRLRAASCQSAAIDQIVPVRDLVVHRTAVMAIGNAAVHAARRLIARRLLAQRQNEFAVMANAVRGRRVPPVGAIDFKKPRDLAHNVLALAAISYAPGAYPSPARGRRWRVAPDEGRAHPLTPALSRERERGSLTPPPRAAPRPRCAPPVPPARAGTRPASPCGTSAGSSPSSPGFRARAPSRCSAHG